MVDIGRKKRDRSPKLASVLKQKISDYFQTEMDLPGMVSITHIDVAGNMQTATVWLSIYHQDADKILEQIGKTSPQIRGYLKQNIVSRYIPRLQFRLDPSEQYADDIGQVLKKIEEDK